MMNRHHLGAQDLRGSSAGPRHVRRFLEGHMLALLLVITAIGCSVLLLPRNVDLALQDIQRGELETAIQRLEDEVRKGAGSPALIAALSNARVDRGEVDGAITDLLVLQAKHPQDMSILTALADYLSAAGHLEGYASALEKMQSLSPTVPRQRDLAHTYDGLERSEDYISALSHLLDMGGAGADDYRDLAQALATHGRRREAAGVLKRLGQALPEAQDLGTVYMELALLLAAGDEHAALGRAHAWLEARRDIAKSGPALAEVFSASGRYDLAADLLDGFASEGAAPQMLAAAAEANHLAGRMPEADRALDMLMSRPGADAAHDLLKLRTAIDLRRPRYVFDLIGRIGIADVPGDLLTGLAEIAITARDKDLLAKVEGAVPEDLRLAQPQLMAKILIALGDHEAAGPWAQRAAQEDWDDAAALISLGHVEIRLKRPERALAALRRGMFLAEEASAPAKAAMPLSRQEIDDAAVLFILLDRPREGWRTLGGLQAQTDSGVFDLGLIRLALATDRQDWVLGQLSGPTGTDAPIAFLEGIAADALAQKAHRVAESAAGLLLSRRGSDSDRLLLAQARVELKKPWVRSLQMASYPAGNSSARP
jgi:tetratricopeptide (TPR) repeat protein